MRFSIEVHSLGDTHCRFSAKLFSEWLHLSLPATERALADLTPPGTACPSQRTVACCLHVGVVPHTSERIGLCHSLCVCGSFLQLRPCGQRSALRRRSTATHRCPRALPTVRRSRSRSHRSSTRALPLDRRRIPPPTLRRVAAVAFTVAFPFGTVCCDGSFLSYRIALLCSFQHETAAASRTWSARRQSATACRLWRRLAASHGHGSIVARPNE